MPGYRRGMMTAATFPQAQQLQPIGTLLRHWREQRRLSQMALALDADISSRHLSFLETGRAQPSRDMVLRLAEHLQVPLRERNTLLLAAGFAPAYPERALDDPALRVARQAVQRVLEAHAPYPALAVDRHWNLLAANRVVPHLLVDVSPALLQPPVNVLRVSLHPEGLAPHIVNLGQWRAHLLERLAREAAISADSGLEALLRELRALPTPVALGHQEQSPTWGAVAVPLILETGLGRLQFISTTMVFGSPVDITLAELAIEAFFPADAATAERLSYLPVHEERRTS